MKSLKFYSYKLNSSLLKEALRSYSASIEDRKKGTFLIKKNPELKQELIDLAFSKKQDREKIVAYWVFERFVLIDEIIEIKLYIDPFLNAFGNQKHESKPRPFAKILYCYCENEKNRAQLSTTQNDIIVACCFDTLIEAKKVAPKVFTLKNTNLFQRS